MQRILSKNDMQKADRWTSEEMHLPPSVLMERAALKIACEAEELLIDCPKNKSNILVLAGTGNNGADAIAAGRILLERGWKSIDVSLIGAKEKRSSLLTQQLISYKEALWVYGAVDIDDEDDEDLSIESHIMEGLPESEDYDLIIDGLLGLSFHGSLREPFKRAIEYANFCKSKSRILSVDLPSGVYADPDQKTDLAVEADSTVCLGMYKPSLLIFPGKNYAGRVSLAEIGIPQGFDGFIHPPYPMNLLEKEDAVLPLRKSNSHKGTYGKILIIAGNEEMAGAALLSARAALMSGAGMVRVLTHSSNRTIIASALPESLISVYDGADSALAQLEKSFPWCDSIAIGPGLGRGETSRALTENVIRHEYPRKMPLVLDADALNIISESPVLMQYLLSNNSISPILTPHIGEMKRLIDSLSGPAEIPDPVRDPIGAARLFSRHFRLCLALKSAVTIVSDPEARIYINSFLGNNGMSTAGSGDVLTGITAAIAAAPSDENEALSTGLIAARAVAVHALCGDIAAQKKGRHSMTASDIIEGLAELDHTRQTMMSIQ